MSFARFIAPCLGLALVGGASSPPHDDTRDLRPGITPAEVRQAFGPPKRLARQVLYHRYLEQWIYDAPASLRVEFDYPRGLPARFTSARTTGED
jgi:hypothetical protein